ncbi:MAG TPA: hypothetical protein VK468_02110, partial [Pyrinomonadaceae bacterium]|nr:hypothetical protein [Pyrinomonadaceae bacterium]
ASFDIVITFPITAALAGFFIFDQSSNGRARYAGLFLFYFFIGVALLAKGLIGIVFPFAIVIFYYLLSRRIPRRDFLISLIWGSILAAAVAAIWYVPMYRVNGYAFIQEFFIEHHFQRYTSNKYFHPQPFYFFLWVLPLMTIPWLPFFAAAIWKQIRGVRTNQPGELVATSTDFRVFAFAWLAVPLVFFSFSGSKLPGYILPSLPAALMLTADFVFGFVRGDRRRSRLIYGLAMATFAVVMIAAIFAAPRFADSDSVRSLIAAADARGHAGETVINMHSVSHNAEYYAPGRLMRTPDGKLAKLLGPSPVRDEIDREGDRSVLVLIPLEYVKQLTDADYLKSEVIADNGETAIVAVSAK